MAITLDKLLSLLVALGYAALGAAVQRSIGTGLFVFGCSLIPLSLIWFPEWWGSLGSGGKRTVLNNEEGQAGRGGTWRASPPTLIALLGWFFLVGLPLVGYLTSR
jgi:hypothetical protein